MIGGSQSLSDLRKQFADEARIHSMVSHPAIAAFKHASLDSSPMYFVIEYVDGITLKEYMQRNRGVTWEETIDFSCRLLSALSHIHSKNIVHCDIKPQNILVTANSGIKLIDFGIARMAGKLPDLPKDKAVGTVQYVSPEQAGESRSTTEATSIPWESCSTKWRPTDFPSITTIPTEWLRCIPPLPPYALAR